jgi:serine/threonine-protein kinase RsbW
MVASACRLVVDGRKNELVGKLKRDGQFTAQVMSAFGEAFNNVVLHSYDADGGHLQIEIELATDALTIRIMDFGKTFDIHSVPTPNLDDLPESGLGLFIIRSCMDVVSYVPGSPNVMSMTKYIGKQ